MKTATLKQIDVLTGNLAAHERNLKTFAATLGQLHEQLQSMIVEIEWDRARLDGLGIDGSPILETEQDPQVLSPSDTSIETGEDAAELAATLATTLAIIDEQAELPTIDDTAPLSSADIAKSIEAPQTATETATDLPMSTDEPIAIAHEAEIEAAAAVVIEQEPSLQSTLADAHLVVETTQTGTLADGPLATDAASNDAASTTATSAGDIEIIEAASHATDVSATVTLEPTPELTTELTTDTDCTIIDLAARRRKRSRSLARNAMVAASMMLIATGSVFYGERLQMELGDHLSRLATCNLAAISTDSDCAALAWLSL